VTDAAHGIHITGCGNNVTGVNDVIVGSDVKIIGSSDTVESNTVATPGDKIIVLGSGDTIVGNNVTGTAWPAAQVYNGAEQPWDTSSTAVVIITQGDNETFTNNTLSALYDNGGQQVTVASNAISGLVEINWSDFNNTIVNNTISAPSLALYAGFAQNNLLADNDVVYLELASGADRNEFTHNVVGGTMSIKRGADGNVAHDNVVRSGVFYVGHGANRNVITSNEIDGDAYFDYGADANIFINNTVGGDVMIIHGANRNVVINNTIGQEGLNLENGVNDNVIEFNEADYVNFQHNANRNIVTHNTADYINFESDASDNTVSWNHATDTTNSTDNDGAQIKVYDFARGNRIINVTAPDIILGAYASTMPTAPPNPPAPAPPSPPSWPGAPPAPHAPGAPGTPGAPGRPATPATPPTPVAAVATVNATQYVTAAVGVAGYTAAQFGAPQQAAFVNGTASSLNVHASDVSILNVTDFTVGAGLSSRRLLTAGVNVNFHVAATPASFSTVLHATTAALTTSSASHLAALQSAGLTQASGVELTSEPALQRAPPAAVPVVPAPPPPAAVSTVVKTTTTTNRDLLALIVLLVLVPICFAAGLHAGSKRRAPLPVVDEAAAAPRQSSKLAAEDVAPAQMAAV
jgi:hypothetical protein